MSKTLTNPIPVVLSVPFVNPFTKEIFVSAVLVVGRVVPLLILSPTRFPVSWCDGPESCRVSVIKSRSFTLH